MQGGGLYKYDFVSTAAQATAQDMVTLGLGLPLLFISMLMCLKNQLRGKLLLCGTLAYFLYTYTSYAVGAAYNRLFLAYVALFSLSLFALIFSLMTKVSHSRNKKGMGISVAEQVMRQTYLPVMMVYPVAPRIETSADATAV